MASDPFAQNPMAHMHISDQHPKQSTEKQPPYVVQGINPTTVTMAPSYAQNNSYVASPTVQTQAPTLAMPAPVSPMQAPVSPMKSSVSPMQASVCSVSPVQASVSPMNSSVYPTQITYPPMRGNVPATNPYVGNNSQTYPPPLQVNQSQNQYAVPPAGAQNPANAPSPGLFTPPQAPVPQCQIPPIRASAPPFSVASYDPFSPPSVPAGPAPVTPSTISNTETNPFAASTPPIASASEGGNVDVAAEDPDANAVDITEEEADFWAQMGFAVQETPSKDAEENTSAENSSRPGLGKKRMSLRASIVRTVPKTSAQKKDNIPEEENAVDEHGLPRGGEYYDALLSGGFLGTTFVSAEEMGVNLFSTAPEQFIKALGKRPVVGYTCHDSVIDKAGISVGEVLIKVGDNDVDDAKSATCVLQQECDKNCGFRNIVIHMWKPPSSVQVTHAENQCVVEYHHKSLAVPATNSAWKSKYVVIGGIAADPWMINMYYNKHDYDKAISDINEKKRKVTVKVKSWSLIGAKLITPEPKTVHYMMQSCRRPWYYIIITILGGKTIKIGHPLLKGIEPVLEGVKKGIECTKTYKGF